MEGSPLGIAGLLLTIHTVLYLWKYIVWGQRASGAAMGHAPGLVGTYFMLIFYMYIYLTKTSLDIFNCNTSDPPDGFKCVGYCAVCEHSIAADVCVTTMFFSLEPPLRMELTPVALLLALLLPPCCSVWPGTWRWWWCPAVSRVACRCACSPTLRGPLWRTAWASLSSWPPFSS